MAPYKSCGLFGIGKKPYECASGTKKHGNDCVVDTSMYTDVANALTCASGTIERDNQCVADLPPKVCSSNGKFLIKDMEDMLKANDSICKIMFPVGSDIQEWYDRERTIFEDMSLDMKETFVCKDKCRGLPSRQQARRGNNDPRPLPPCPYKTEVAPEIHEAHRKSVAKMRGLFNNFPPGLSCNYENVKDNQTKLEEVWLDVAQNADKVVRDVMKQYVTRFQKSSEDAQGNPEDKELRREQQVRNDFFQRRIHTYAREKQRRDYLTKTIQSLTDPPIPKRA